MSESSGHPPASTYRYVRTAEAARPTERDNALKDEEQRSRRLYLDIVDEQCRLPDVEVGRMLRSEGLEVRGKVFAMFVGDRLVVKIPAERVDDVVAAGDGARFEPTEGRVMREWLAGPLPPGDEAASRWRELVDEARAFVTSLQQGTRTRR